MSEPAAKKRKFTMIKAKKKNKLFKLTKGKFLGVGHRGFLATCNYREKNCIREAYNVLNTYADELYGPVENERNVIDYEKKSFDIADALQRQIADLNAKYRRTLKNRNPNIRFSAVGTGAKNCVFIRTSLKDPVELGTAIVKDVAIRHEQKTRFLLRLVPVEMVCHANLRDITSTGNVLFDKYFLKKGTTYAIVFNKRFNNDVKRDSVINELAALVQLKNEDNRVDLKHAEKTIIVEVIKGLCCMSVLDGYLKYKKYNLIELANAKETNKADTKDGKQSEIVSIELSKDSQEAEDNKKEQPDVLDVNSQTNENNPA